VVARAFAGAAIALGIVLLARRARALSISGAVAAFLLGTIAIACGWRWGALLMLYFASSTALSRFRAAAKDARTAGMVEKGGERDAIQVLANGLGFGIAAGLALLPSVISSPDALIRVAALGVGSLAASASDTWATEIGTLAPHPPRSIVSWRRVLPGSSGGVTPVGFAAAAAGAAFIALVALVLGWSPRIALAATLGGIVGSTLDSVLGATLQARRWCDRCQRPTERERHDCGELSRRDGGMSWLGNDAVNLVTGIAGGLVATWLAR
jgi:uncharacterized protein (TIGR00297 family)